MGLHTEVSQVVRPLDGPAGQKCHNWCGLLVSMSYRSVTNGAATGWACCTEVSQVEWPLEGPPIQKCPKWCSH